MKKTIAFIMSQIMNGLTSAGLYFILMVCKLNSIVSILLAVAFYIVLLIFDSVTMKKGLEAHNRVIANIDNMREAHGELINECNQLEIDLANQVMSTDICEKKYKNSDLAIYNLYKILDDIDTTSDMYKDNLMGRCKRIDKLIQERFNVGENIVKELYDKFYNKEEDILTPLFETIPFTEDMKQCPICKDDMRKTAKMWVCDNCKHREKQ